MRPATLGLAADGLAAAERDLADAEGRAHAALDALRGRLPGEPPALAQALAALDRVDAALRDLRAAARALEAPRGDAPRPLVALR